MTHDQAPLTPGAVALVGSGEYTPAMRDADAYLLGTIGGAASASVALLPTASGKEPGSPVRWNAMGAQHFAALGVRDIRAVALTDRAGADDPDLVAQLQGATFYYFSGGDPGYLIDCLRETRAWTVIAEQHARGAVLAGCSAGAMALGGRTMSMRSVQLSGTVVWRPALGIVPNAICFPHFDRMSRFIGDERFQAMLAAIPDGSFGLGLDEDTALVRTRAASSAGDRAHWRVMGRQTVSVFQPGQAPRVLRNGEEIDL